VRQNAAFEERFKLVLDELRYAGPCAGFYLSEEGRGVLLNEAIQRGLFGTVAFVLNPSAIGQPTGLSTGGSLHANSPEDCASEHPVRRQAAQST
jgi:hypothetical protein